MNVFLIIGIIVILIYVGLYPAIDVVISKENKRNEDRYDISRHITNTMAFWIPFISTFCASFFLIKDFRKCPIIGVPISLFLSFVTGLIGSLIGHKINISNADIYDIKETDERVRREKIDLGVTAVSGIKSSYTLCKKTKEAIKDISNPEGWSETK